MLNALEGFRISEGNSNSHNKIATATTKCHRNLVQVSSVHNLFHQVIRKTDRREQEKMEAACVWH